MRGHAGHGGVDVQPEARVAADLADRRHRDRTASVDVVPSVAQQKNGRRPAARSAAICAGELVGSHREGVVDRDQAHARLRHAGDRAGPSRPTSGSGSSVARPAPPPRRRPVASGDDRAQAASTRPSPGSRRRRCPSDRKAGGRPSASTQPVHDVRLELRADRRRRPEHPLHAEPGRHQLAEDARAAVVGREERVPAGRAASASCPVRRPGRGRRRSRPRPRPCSGARRRAAARARRRAATRGCTGRSADPLHVGGDPLDQLVPDAAELVGRHVRRRHRGRALAGADSAVSTRSRNCEARACPSARRTPRSAAGAVPA